MQTSFTKHQVVLLHYHSPNVHVVLVKRTAGWGSGSVYVLYGEQTHSLLLDTIGPRQKHANISERYLQSRSSNTGNVRDSEMYTIILLLAKKQDGGREALQYFVDVKSSHCFKKYTETCVSFVVSKALNTGTRVWHQSHYEIVPLVIRVYFSVSISSMEKKKANIPIVAFFFLKLTNQQPLGHYCSSPIGSKRGRLSG